MGKQGIYTGILSILLFLGLPFFSQLELFPFQKLTMFSSNIPMQKVERTVILVQNRKYYHPATSYMLKKEPDCGLASEILTAFYKVDMGAGGVQVLQETVLQGDTATSILLDCP